MYRIKEFASIPSTSDYLKDNYKSLEDTDVVVAKHQTKGHGRLGRVWQDDSSSLLFSILLKNDIHADSASLIPLLAGAAVLSAFQELGVSSSIKWPNDLMLGDKKCTGIIVEGVSEEKIVALVVGIGVNVNNVSFDSSIQEKATSLRLYEKHTFDKKEVLRLIISSFDKLYKDYLKGDNSFISIIKTHSYLDGKEVYLDYYDEKKRATVIGIQDDGRLLIESDGKKSLLNAGEVSLQSVYASSH